MKHLILTFLILIFVGCGSSSSDNSSQTSSPSTNEISQKNNTEKIFNIPNLGNENPPTDDLSHVK